MNRRKLQENILQYQILRDAFAAINASRLRDQVSQTGRIILWAHHSHVNHNMTKVSAVSMGHHLKLIHGPSLYTLGTFVGDGDALIADDSLILPFVYSRVSPAKHFELEGFLEKQSRGNFYLNFRNAPPESPLRKTMSTCYEGTPRQKGVPADNYDGALFVEHVTPATPIFWPRSLQILSRFYGFFKGDPRYWD